MKRGSRMRLGLGCLALCTAWLGLWIARAEAPAGEAGFVRVAGNGFVLDGAPFRFLGANVSIMHGQRERQDYEAVLDAVAADGLKVVRLWALGEQLAPGEPYHPLYAFRIGESGWVEESFAHLDRVLVAAKARGLKAIVVLANRWKDYGGIATYLRWGGAEVARDERGEPLGSALAAFFECVSCQALYREHVARVVARVNSVSHQAYRDDPTIMAWELINEASGVSAREEEALLHWVQSSARLVRSFDRKHLISAGHIGYHTSRERRVWRAVQRLPEVDFADAHLYPQTDQRVATAGQSPLARAGARFDLAALLDDPIALAQLELQKPLVFGEFGFERAPQAGSERSRWTEAFLGHFLSGGAAGALIWLYEPAGNPRRTHSISASPQDADSERVRRTLRSAVLRLSQVGPYSIPAAWTGAAGPPLFAPRQDTRSVTAPHRGFVRRGREQVLDIDPVDFALASFERVGVYDNHTLETVWGAGEGYVEYRFIAPRVSLRGLRVAARISSELPGAGDGQDPRDGSDVEISLDDELLGTVRAKPDDGLGEVVEVALRDARLLGRLFRTRSHVLRLRALPSRYAGGLCIYGTPTGRPPLPPGAARDVSSVRVSLEPLRESQARRSGARNPADQVGSLLADHDGGGVGVASDDAGHDGGVGHAQAVDAAHAE